MVGEQACSNLMATYKRVPLHVLKHAAHMVQLDDDDDGDDV